MTLAATSVVTAMLSAAPGTAADPAPAPGLHLVTLPGPGTSGSDDSRAELLAEQDAVLADIGGPDPVYRWSTALNGFAVSLHREQVALLEADPRVARVEPNDVRRAATASSSAGATNGRPPSRGGAGVVVGVVGTGIAPELPVFADVPDLGRAPHDFRGGCEPAEGWSASSCGRKLVGAAWFVEGFGASRVGSSEELSPRDEAGSGTQLAALAAGNAGVTMRLPQDDPESGNAFGGAAPQARIAAYKACWTAPDPADDGCATADLVTAVDRAAADRVDVLTLGVDGPTVSTPGVDTLDR
ncbi:MAG TPA: S8 family serine peptidase, partial [Nocardioides sp.]